MSTGKRVLAGVGAAATVGMMCALALALVFLFAVVAMATAPLWDTDDEWRRDQVGVRLEPFETEIFTGRAILSSDNPTAEIPFILRPRSNGLTMRPEVEIVGGLSDPSSSEQRTIDESELVITSVEDTGRGGGVVSFELTDLSLAPIEIRWMLKATASSFEPSHLPILTVSSSDPGPEQPAQPGP